MCVQSSTQPKWIFLTEKALYSHLLIKLEQKALNSHLFYILSLHSCTFCVFQAWTKKKTKQKNSAFTFTLILCLPSVNKNSAFTFALHTVHPLREQKPSSTYSASIVWTKSLYSLCSTYSASIAWTKISVFTLLYIQCLHSVNKNLGIHFALHTVPP